MKKLVSLFVAIFLAGMVFAACDVPNGYNERQQVTAYVLWDTGNVASRNTVTVYQANNMCDAFCVCYYNYIYYVSRSDNSNYRYMFWDNDGIPHYFNM